MSICPNACRLWPHTLYCGEETTCKQANKKWEEGCGIITEVAMRGIVLGACAQLGRPMVLLERKPEGCVERGKGTPCNRKSCESSCLASRIAPDADSIA